MKSYVNFCARVSWDPCILATCVCRSLRPGSAAGKISGSVASRADNLFARFARRCFFSPTPIFSPFHNAEPMRSPVPGLSQAMSVDISSPVFTLTKWQEGRSRWAVSQVSQKRKCVLWGLGRKKKEARGGP